jgi:hypothetical protein
MSVLILDPCPINCAASLGAVSYDPCAPERHYGEISKLYIGRIDGADFTNVDLIGEWTTRLSDTTDTADSIRALYGMGEMPMPEQTEKLVSRGEYAYSPFTFNFTFNVDDTNDINYEFMMLTYCNQRRKIWLEMSDKMLYGGNEGIEAILKGGQPLLPGREDFILITFSAKWKAVSWPLRTLSPVPA